MSNTFEILARGLCYDGKWREGDLCHHRDGSVTIRPIGSTDGLGYYVKRETVTPYVQRTDKNGKKVFLGDICRYEEDCFFVGYYDEDSSFTIDGKGAEWLPNKGTFASEIEVIGNIWDNPEEYQKLLAFYKNGERKEAI